MRKTQRKSPTVSVTTYRESPLYPRIVRAVKDILTRSKVVAPVDVLVGMHLLTPKALEDWRRGRVPYLERVINCNLTRLSRLLRILRFHAYDLNLVPSVTVYNRWSKGRKHRLRFTKTGDPRLEEAYARHFVWPGKRLLYGDTSDSATANETKIDEARQLLVRVNEELVLDAGTYEETAGPHGPELLIRPPATTLFHQVLSYLKAKPDPPPCPSGSMADREGVAAAAVVLRWGSYLAVLLNRDQPLWSAVGSQGLSRIGDEEMARINIEASAALAEWIDLLRMDRNGGLYTRLVDRAVSYLPMPKKMGKFEATQFATLAEPEIAARLLQANRPELVERRRLDANRFPSRIFANALVNTAWRNGPVEEIHAGLFEGCPLGQRRVAPREAWKLVSFASAGLAMGISVCYKLTAERPQRAWAEQVLPYGLATMMLITPSGWTHTEDSREVRLPAPPAAVAE